MSRDPEPHAPDPDQVARELREQIARARETLVDFRNRLAGQPSARERAHERENEPLEEADPDAWKDRP